MNDFIQSPELARILESATSMPTVVFSVLLLLVTLYWTVRFLGIFSFEALEAFGGLGEAAEALADGDRPSTGVFDSIGFGDVPRSISWSLIIFFAWGISLATSLWVPSVAALAVTGMAYSAAFGGLALVGAIGVTALAIQPLRKVLETPGSPRHMELVGRVCTVRTLRVDAGFGQVEVDEGSMLVQARNPSDEVSFVRGEKALIYDYDPAREVFLVAPYDDKLEKLR